MKEHIKDKILDVAIKLFNEKGYHAVSMRSIAQELPISVGNLTYYYKKKEDLIEEAVLRQHEGYQKAPTPTSVRELNAFFKKIIYHQSANTFYFRHYTQLAQLSPRVYAIQRQVLQDWFTNVKGAFTCLSASGQLSPEPFPGQWDALVAALRLCCIHGADEAELTGEQLLRLLWGLIYPQLTPAGRLSLSGLESV